MAKKITEEVFLWRGQPYEDNCEYCGKHIPAGLKKIIRISNGSTFCSKQCEREDRLG